MFCSPWRRLEKAQRRGPLYLLMHVVVSHFKYALRAEHGWLSVMNPPKDEQLVLTRTQRAFVLLAKLMAAMALNAAVFGNDPTQMSGVWALPSVFYCFFPQADDDMLLCCKGRCDAVLCK